ncbi:MAG: hypothetical protein K2L98_00565, partial [Bacilli bacterium]|nr:hypothetical protein [Bacilli bacterium]
IGLIVMTLMKGTDMSNDLIVTMMSYITYLKSSQIISFINRVGKVRVIMAGLGYGIASSITFGLAYNIVSKFQNIFKSIITGEMYTKENVKILNEALPLTCIFAFAQPVIIYVIVETTHIFQLADINVSGIAFIMATYILKLTFEKGYELAEANIVYDKELSDIKAKESEAKMAEIKKELAEKKANATKTSKKSTETTAKKPKKAQPKKTTAKKATTK